MSELVCPYCEKDCEADFELNEEYRIYKHECENCDKTFVYTLSYATYYYEEPAPCLNGEADHEWVPVTGWPAMAFAGKERCSVCDKRRQVAPPATQGEGLP